MTRNMHMRRLGLKISPDLTLSLGGATAPITPRAGLRLAEELTRKSFRKMLAEEADKPSAPGEKRRAGGPRA